MRKHLGIGVDLAIMVDVVAQVVFQLGDEAGFNEGHWGSIDAGFALDSRNGCQKSS